MNTIVNYILISGKARSGKNTVADRLETVIRQEGIKVVRVSFANKIKTKLLKLNQNIKNSLPNLSEDERKEIIRPAYQMLGQTAREIQKDYWVQELKYEINRILNEIKTHKHIIVIIDDWRYENEIEIGKPHITIRVERDNHKLIDDSTHISETELDNFEFDEVINSDDIINEPNNYVFIKLLEKYGIIVE